MKRAWQKGDRVWTPEEDFLGDVNPGKIGTIVSFVDPDSKVNSARIAIVQVAGEERQRTCYCSQLVLA